MTISMSDKEIFKYPGQESDVHWNGKLCIHIGECGRAKGELFINGRQPWCQPDLALNEEGCGYKSVHLGENGCGSV